MFKRVAGVLLIITTVLAACGPSQAGVSDSVTQIATQPGARIATPSAIVPATSVPSPAATATPIPSHTPLPTRDATAAAGTAQAQAAAAQAQTATAAIYAGFVPQNETAEAAWLATGRAVVNSVPDCAAGDEYNHCRDAVLNIAFAYPPAWGEISARRFAGDTGSGYQYQFTPGTTYPQAGGDSRDFTQARDRTLIDFAGFGPDASTAPDKYLSYGAMLTRTTPAGVLVLFAFPAAEYVCKLDHGSGTVVAPLGVVAIDLPRNPKINGFVFVATILSAPLWKDLAAVLGLQDQTQAAKCQDAALRQQFDGKVAEVVAAIQAGTVDAGTQANLDQLMHLAQSIRFD